MKYKKYHILSVISLMIILTISEICDLLGYINDHGRSSKISYIYIINLVLLIISFGFLIKGLLQRFRWALIVNIISLSLLVVANLMGDTYFEFDIFLLSYILLSLIIQRKWFKAKSHFIKLKIGIGLACFLFAVNIILNVIFISRFNDINMLINLCLFLIIIKLTLKPKNLRIEHTYEDKLKVQDLLRKFSTNPVSAIILEDDKQYFFPRFCEGVIGYTVVNNIAIVAGEPICSDKEIENILSEFKNFCSDNSLSICFCQVSKKVHKGSEECWFYCARIWERSYYLLGYIYDKWF
ncbi:lysylphosphatidylglycerol synthetase-like protein (DUF2156 family) [Clostridium beijerinckii]|uniref:phosphatidylglycerol lysyltransferase domain-containing protein n=1 Tax=Clostridium beijerinckii TaxID=1520 RepID=UPI0020C6AD83|nr:phosphatidylglycerol lysyltransferase domain-containing protein [Clostridium beijerinckii]NRZ85860.1 lysylphosphatidylglycerol synthetase-like protein (DUF2156 family) [Clostridium beijerinckii]